MVKALIEAGADLSFEPKDTSSKTLLDLAMNRGNKDGEAINELLRNAIIRRLRADSESERPK